MANDTATNLVVATWGLVAATTLLVIATSIPAVKAIIDRIREKKALATRIVPDLHILRDRVDKWANDLLAKENPTKAFFEEYVEVADHDLELLGRIASGSPHFGMEFASEVYVCRHLLTQTMYELRRCAKLSEEPLSEKVVKEKSASLSRATTLYLAAKLSLVRMDELVPAWSQRIGEEKFADRFKRLNAEREAEAEKQLVDLRRQKRRV